MFGTMGQTNVKNLGNGGTMDGDVTITGDLTVSGGIGLTLSEVIQGTSTIDVTNAEALLVRKDGDSGDVFLVDTTNSRVGIGGTPSDDLHVINSENVYLQLESSNTGTTKESAIKYSNFSTGSNFWWAGLNQSDDYSLAYGTSFSGANTRLLLTETSELGIGISPNADTPLHIHRDSSSTQTIFFDNDGTGRMDFVMRNDRSTEGSASHSIFFDGADDGGNNARYATIENHIVDNTNGTEDGKLVFSTMVAGTDTETLNITGGNVGINCDHPSVPLEVELSGDTGTYFEGGGSGDGASDLRHLTMTASTTTSAGDTHTLNAESSTGVLKFATSGSDRMIINSTGVGIGGTPSRKLESINTNAGADTLLLQLRNNSSNTSTSSSLRFVNSTSGTSSAGGSEISAIRNANDGGSLTIKTAQDSSATLTTALTINSSQLATFSDNIASSRDNFTISANSGLFQLRTLEAGQDMLFDTGGDFKFRDVDDSNATRVTIESGTGNVGIGATTIQQLLHIEKDDADVGIALTQSGQRSWSFGIDNSDSDRLKIGYSTTIGTNTVATFTEAGQLGIGGTPTQKLDVRGGLNSVHAMFSGQDNRGLLIETQVTTNNDDTVVLNAQTSSGEIAFETNSTERMRLTSTGLGIGGSPVAQFTITDATSPSLAFYESDEGTHDKLWLQSVFQHDLIHQVRFDNNGGGNQYMVINRDQLKINSIVFKTGGQVTTASTSVEAMRIDSSGDVQLQERLTFSGTNDSIIASSITPHSNGFIYITGGSGGLVVGDDATSSRIQIMNDAEIKFEVNGSEKMRLDSTGLGIGTSSPSGNLLQVFRADGTNSADYTAQIYNADTTSDQGHGLLIRAGNDSNDIPFIVRSRDNNNTYFKINGAGNIGIGTSSPTASKLSISHANNTDYDSYKSNMGATASTHHAVNISNSSNEDNTNERYALLNFFSSYGNSASGQSIIGNVSTGSKQGNFIIGTRGGDSDANVTEKVRVTYDGSVGIGISDPDAYLSGGNNLVLGGTSGHHGLTIRSASDSSGQIFFGDGDASTDAGYRGQIRYIHSSDSFVFVTSSINRMILDANSRISLSNNDASSGNTILGYQAMNVSGASASHNVAIGNEAMHDVNTSQFNVAVGSLALTKEVNGDRNVAVGYQSLYSQSNSGTEVTENVGVGVFSGFTNVTGTKNTYVGGNAGFGSASGSNSNNVGVGYNALLDISTGSNNVAVGKSAGENITSGSLNTLVGLNAGGDLTGSSNTLIGANAGHRGSNDLAGANHCVFIGRETAGSSASANNQIVIGKSATGLADNTVTLGNEFVTDVYMAQDSGATVHAGGMHIEKPNAQPVLLIGRAESDFSPGIVDNDILGELQFAGHEGSNTPNVVAKVLGVADESFGSTSGRGELQFQTGDESSTTTKMTITSSGVIDLPFGQLKFPATQNASSDANTLDDYEEGEYTGVVTCGTSGTVSITSAFDQLAYTKIGNQVTVTGLLVVGSVSSPNGFFKVSLPFAIGDGTELSKRSGSNVYVYDHTSGNISDFVAIGIEGESSVRVYFGDGSGFQSDSANILANGSNIVMGFTYFV